MRQLVELCTIFDWITPTIGFVEDVINDPTLLQSNTWTFFVPYGQALDSGWNAFDISVKLEQAQWAEYLLLRSGVPLNPKFLGAPAARRKRQVVQMRPGRQSFGRFAVGYLFGDLRGITLGDLL